MTSQDFSWMVGFSWVLGGKEATSIKVNNVNRIALPQLGHVRRSCSDI